MHDDSTFAPPADTLTTDERLAELAAILTSAITRTNPRETNENSPLDGDSSLDILALSYEQLRRHLADFLDAYNFARRLKTLSGLTPYEYICKIWTSEPDRFIVDPIHQMPGLNT